MQPPEIDRWFPRRGPCGICGTPGLDQRHRVIDAIADAVAAGDSEEDVAVDMGVSVEAVGVAVAWAAWEKTHREDNPG
jgi:hypothetical protein